jgi:prepilin-type N-terminal cleavage/methylation domain-containing protein
MKNLKGFSIIEMIMAISIMSVMGLMVTSMSAVGLKVDKKINELTEFSELIQSIRYSLKNNGSCTASFKQSERTLPVGSSLNALYTEESAGMRNTILQVGQNFGSLTVKSIRLEPSKRVGTNVILSFLTVEMDRMFDTSHEVPHPLKKSLPIMFNVAKDGSVAGCSSANLMQGNLSLNERTIYCQITKGSGYYYNPATNNCLQPPSMIYKSVVGLHNPNVIQQKSSCDIQQGWSLNSCSYGFEKDTGKPITVRQTYSDGSVKTVTVPPVAASRDTMTAGGCSCTPALGVVGAYCVANCYKEYSVYDLPPQPGVQL